MLASKGAMDQKNQCPGAIRRHSINKVRSLYVIVASILIITDSIAYITIPGGLASRGPQANYGNVEQQKQLDERTAISRGKDQ